ncbi:hypothetical protein ACFYKT_05935 [Cytobacillus sp. FJAT-53684]|uniref:PH domain-containing protein n=1 Tax=Cytobacillus mangrovibacter TaxID=3299024 RepID=A0ABW6JVJ7_9BACI
MGKSSCRFIVSAIGKRGQTYLTHCQDKHELKKWVAEHEDDLLMSELKIIDRKRHPLFMLFSKKR